MMNENYNTPNSGCCGRPFPTAPENKCNYNDCCMNEYAYKQKACIRNKQPDCETQAVIPSITVETVDGITNLANCLVHVTSTNTTYYVDDKHRVMITWAGPVDIPGYDMENNPNRYRDQIVTDIERGLAVIYDKHGRGYTFGIYDGLDADGAVTQAINDKLDEMATDGTLESIIATYIEDVAHVFDTVADMKASTELINGSYARTLGFHTINDGGAATYKITDTGTANEMDVIAVGSSLIANLVYPVTVNPEIFGAYGDGTHDDHAALQYMFDLRKPVRMTKNYATTSTITISGRTLAEIDASDSRVVYSGTSNAFLLQGIYGGDIYFGIVRAANGTCIKMYSTNSTNRIIYTNVSFHDLYAKDACVDIEVKEFGYINELHLYGGEISHGDYGVHYVVDTDHSFEGGSGFYCHNIGFEGSSVNYCLESPYFFTRGVLLENDRHVENTTSTHLRLVGNFASLTLKSYYHIMESRLDFANVGTLRMIDIDCPILKPDDSGVFAEGKHYGYNSSITYVHRDKLTPNVTVNPSFITDGSVKIRKRGNICYLTIDGIRPNGTTNDIVTVANALPVEFIPTSANVVGNCTTVDGETAEFWVRTNGSIAFNGSNSGVGKAFYGSVAYDPDLVNV